jgi:hypothetical protein
VKWLCTRGGTRGEVMRGELTSTEPFGAEGTAVTTWAEAARRFADAVTFWLATVRADRSPHLMPVWA